MALSMVTVEQETLAESEEETAELLAREPHPKEQRIATAADQNDQHNMQRERAKSYTFDGLSCCERLKRSVCPIHMNKTVYKNGDGETHIIVSPEPFLLLSYFWLMGFLVLSAIISLNFGDIDLDNNVLLERFGSNSPCIFLDYPPFNHVAATLYMPALFFSLSYEILDAFRVYDTYVDGKISYRFYSLYNACTYFECFAFTFLVQSMATSPFESIMMHCLPYFCWILALWTLAFKRFMYLHVTGYFKQFYRRGWPYYLGVIYVLTLFFNVLVQLCILLPDLFGAELHKRFEPKLEWLGVIVSISNDIWGINTFIVPIVILLFIAKNVSVLKITINRKVKEPTEQHFIDS